MRLVIDLPSRAPIADFGNLSPAPVNQIKSADTAVLDIYFVEEGIVQDLGSGTSIRFGLIAGNDPVVPLLVYDTVFNRNTDENGNIFYQGFPIFNNSTLLGALGGALNLTCSGEIRYQVPTGEISHSTDIPFLIWRTILPESYYTTTTASVTQPAIGANVTVPVVASGFLAPNSTVSVGSGYDTMSVVSVPDGISFVGHNLGTGSSAPGHVFPSGTIVSLASPNVLATYPDVSTLELKVNKSVPSGYAPLDSTGHLLLAEMPSGVELTAHKNVASGYAGLGSGATISASVIPVDGVTTSVSAGKLVAMAASLGIVSTTQAAFTVPAVASSVAINTPMVNLVPNAYYVIGGGAGVYQLLSITDPNHGNFVNVGSYGNASPGTVIPYGVAIQNTGVPGVAGGGAGGIGATTSAAFTWPSVGSNVTVNVNDATPFHAIFQDFLVYVGPNFGVLQLVSSDVTSTPNTVTLLNNNQYTANGNPPGGTIPSGSSLIILGIQVYDADPSGSSGGTTLVTDDTPSGVPYLPAIRRLKATDSSITLDNSHPVYVGIKANAPSGMGDMLKSTYDTNNDGIVDVAKALTQDSSPGALSTVWGRDASGKQNLFTAPASGGMMDRTTGVELFDDFTSYVTGTGPLPTLGWSIWGGSNGSVTAWTPYAGGSPECGIWQHTPPTNSTGYWNLSLGSQTTNYTIGMWSSGAVYIEWRIAIPTLNTSSNSATVRFGVTYNNPGAANWNAAYFEYDAFNSGANWFTYAWNGSGLLSHNTTVAVNTSFHKFGISIPAAATSAIFTIDGGSSYTASPINLTSGGWSPFFYTKWGIGTPNPVQLDWLYCKYTVSR